MIDGTTALVYPVALAITAVAVVVELRTGRIPNALFLVQVAAAAALSVIDRVPLDRLAAAVVTLLVTFVGFRRRWLGGGAVKHAVGIALVMGLVNGVPAALGGLLAMFAGYGYYARRWASPAEPLRRMPSTPLSALGIVAVTLAQSHRWVPMLHR